MRIDNASDRPFLEQATTWPDHAMLSFQPPTVPADVTCPARSIRHGAQQPRTIFRDDIFLCKSLHIVPSADTLLMWNTPRRNRLYPSEHRQSYGTSVARLDKHRRYCSILWQPIQRWGS